MIQNMTNTSISILEYMNQEYEPSLIKDYIKLTCDRPYMMVRHLCFLEHSISTITFVDDNLYLFCYAGNNIYQFDKFHGKKLILKYASEYRFMISGQPSSDDHFTDQIEQQYNLRNLEGNLLYSKYTGTSYIHVYAMLEGYYVFSTDHGKIRLKQSYYDFDVIHMWKDNLVMVGQKDNILEIFIHNIDKNESVFKTFTVVCPMEYTYLSCLYDNCLFLTQDNNNVLMINLQTEETMNITIINDLKENIQVWHCDSAGLLYMFSHHRTMTMQLPTWEDAKKMKDYLGLGSNEQQTVYYHQDHKEKNIIKPKYAIDMFEYFNRQASFHANSGKEQKLCLPDDVNPALFNQIIDTICFPDHLDISIDELIECINICDMLQGDYPKKLMTTHLYLKGHSPDCLDYLPSIMNSCGIDELLQELILDWIFFHAEVISDELIDLLYKFHVSIITKSIKRKEMSYSATKYVVKVIPHEKYDALSLIPM